ncbi:response regulator [Bradyrhizobium sp. UFLA03-84]|uniref:response regulator n=1 Tax=Bradyrhizobium sp. UFLA03-84 TaxID=418599 RepID=UPI000BAE19D4|nr:response regulator [Bradyrhizobium sp. UFLA03-84]PAY06793.1 response regulator [Bradyrhizobium sp. UFLA03-84]
MAKRKILIVEDEYFIADDCAHAARSAGFQVIGPFGSVTDAISNMPDDVDGALLDVNLQGSKVYPLLDKLLSLNIPVAIYTGYEPQNLPAQYSSLTIVTKPGNCIDAVRSLTFKIQKLGNGDITKG